MYYKAIKTKLKLNNHDCTLMAKHAGLARWVYNWGLRLWSEGDKEGVKPSANTLKKLFTNYVKPQFSWMSELSSRVYQYAFISLGDAFKRFFKKLGGYPKFNADCEFGEFRRQLEYKCAKYARELLIADRFYPSSQLSSCCGIRQKMPVQVRVYDCINCELSIDRDLNAAINLCNWGRLVPGCLLRVNRSHAPDDAESKQQCQDLSDVASVL